MDHSYPYIASLTREPFLFYEMRSTAKLMAEGNSDDAIVKEIVEQNLFQYPTEKSITRMAKACIKRLQALEDDSLVSAIASQPTDVAFLSGQRMIALSNETSANETTVRGSFVNHQYSKSYEFEQDFQNYIGQITTSDIHYFSFLRPLAEIEIAALFAQCRDYHRVFLSCNRGSKKGIWCCDCPKCLFVYIILSPFLPEEELVGIFGEKLLDKPSLEKDFRELVGIDENKPFECVGTRSEVGCALKAFVEKGGRSLLTDRYREEILGERESLAEYLNRWEDRNHVPSEYQQILKEKLAEAREAALG